MPSTASTQGNVSTASCPNATMMITDPVLGKQVVEKEPSMACGGEDGLEEALLPSVAPSSAPPLGRNPQGHEFDLLATGSYLTGLLRACPEAANRDAAPCPVSNFLSCLDFKPLLWWFPELLDSTSSGAMTSPTAQLRPVGGFMLATTP
ncbi:hypothetical protein D623_10003026 [Myotis brandtii]|uniref:Uncharacterized protein n=1 Tax=Myotis brandtii TaxID=109478 RepID=S7N045_MYOBR|nr:hypothetical protein D623_10003026 [Myotis brandtii]